ncbi:MAG: phage capsid protein [Clostridia bacterium]|jgi:A118 family predicted phage portal protein|nr:phage capsid protein [Clostridia bacterium]
MFERVISFIKGAINKMFNTGDIVKDFNIDISTSDEVMKLIEKCANIYNHKAPWLNEEVKSLNVAKTICEKVAKAVTIEFKSQAEDKEIDNIYQRFLKNIRTNTEYTLAKGGMFFKPFYSNGRIKVSCIHADKFIPVKFDSTGELLGAIFIDQITKGDDVYTRLEYNDLNDTTITIKNIVYKTNKNNLTTLGNKVSLSQVPEWKDIQEQTQIEHVNKLLGGYFKIPIANPVDNTSPIGVPIFANAIKTLEEIDKQFSRTLWEYEAKEPAIDVDATAFKKDEDGNDILPKGKERLYRRLDFGDEKQWNIFSPEIRDTSLFNGLNELLRYTESQCGLSFGILSKNTEVEKRVEEIKTSKQDYFVTVSDIQGSLQTALEDMLYGIDVLMSLYDISHKSNANTSFDWDDSILVDSEKKQSQALVERNAGLIDDIEYFVQTRDYSEEEATEYVDKMKQRSPEEPVEQEEKEE